MTTAYEKIISRMRMEVSHGNKKGLQYAEALSTSEIRVGDTRMSKDFFEVCQHVGGISKGDILICCLMDEDTYVILGKVVL